MIFQSRYLRFMQGLLEGVSYSFTKNFQFLDSIKAHLSYTLLRASVSQFPVIFQVLPFDLFFCAISEKSFAVIVLIVLFLSHLQYATGIFAVLLLRFRESLKV